MSALPLQIDRADIRAAVRARPRHPPLRRARVFQRLDFSLALACSVGRRGRRLNDAFWELTARFFERSISAI